MSKNNSSSSSGIGFFGLLQILFIALKLLGKITWTWAQVLIPTWIGLGILVILLVFLFISYLNIKK